MTVPEQIIANTQSVIDGKTAIAQAITAKGVTTSNNALFSVMADNIGEIPSRKEAVVDPPSISPQSSTQSVFPVTVSLTAPSTLPTAEVYYKIADGNFIRYSTTFTVNEAQPFTVFAKDPNGTIVLSKFVTKQYTS